MKVSVIIPLYNKERYIRRCLDSVLGQTYKDLEVVVINDGSTDKSLAEANSFQDSRLRILDVPNGGVSRARNLGIEQATGDYLLFVDSDDYISPTYIEHLVSALPHGKCDMLMFGITKVFPDGRQEEITMPLSKDEDDFYAHYMQIQNEHEGICGYVCSRMMRRSFLVENIIRFNPNIRLAEDVDFYLNCFEHNPRLAFTEETGYYYIQEADNSLIRQKNVDFFSLISIWMRALRMLKEKGFESSNRDLIAEKVQGLMRAHFLECGSVSLSSIKHDLQHLHACSQGLDEVWHQLYESQLLTRLVVRQHPSEIYSYLMVRRIFHIVVHQWLGR